MRPLFLNLICFRFCLNVWYVLWVHGAYELCPVKKQIHLKCSATFNSDKKIYFNVANCHKLKRWWSPMAVRYISINRNLWWIISSGHGIKLYMTLKWCGVHVCSVVSFILLFKNSVCVICLSHFPYRNINVYWTKSMRTHKYPAGIAA